MSDSTPFPLLRSDHKILGSEYCSGYSDVFGKWNTGFYCPQSESKAAVSCCGTPTYKYCCTAIDPNAEPIEVEVTPQLLQTTLILGIVGGTFLCVFLLILTSCYFCSCCFFYKKMRREHLPGGLYRMTLGASSSTTSALLNTYSNSSSFNNNTPLDSSDWIQFHTNPIYNNGHLNSSTPLNNQSTSNGFNPQSNGFNPQLIQYLSAQTLHNGSVYPYSTLPRYLVTNQPRPGQNANFSAGSSLHGSTPPPLFPRNPPLNSQNMVPPPPPYSGATTPRSGGAASRPYMISNNFSGDCSVPLAERPQSVISIRNNVAYITSSLPLSNSFTPGRRAVHFRDTDLVNDLRRSTAGQPATSNKNPGAGKPKSNVSGKVSVEEPPKDSAVVSTSKEAESPLVEKLKVTHDMVPAKLLTSTPLPLSATGYKTDTPQSTIHSPQSTIHTPQSTHKQSPTKIQEVDAAEMEEYRILLAVKEDLPEPQYKVIPSSSSTSPSSSTSHTTSSSSSTSIKNNIVPPLVETHRILI